MANVRIKRGTRAQIEAAAAGGALADGEPYLITDEGRIAVGTGTGAFSAMAKQSEVASGGLAAPNTPALVSPAAGADGGKVFTVGAYSHPLGAPKWCTQIQRARDAAFTVDVESSSIATQDTSTTATLTWDVRTGTNYWRARDIDVFGVASEWSAARAYNTPAGVFTGGALTQDGDYSVRTFTTSGTLTVSANSVADVLIVAGGGGGGSYGGGGGGGGVAYIPGQAFVAGTYSVIVGAGGAGTPAGQNSAGGKGGDSSVSGLATATGGGGGGSSGSPGSVGGSGGGGGWNAAGGAGTSGQGFAGGAGTSDPSYAGGGGGGGGGAGAAPANGTAGAGGAGFACAISPAATHYAGGGGAGIRWGYTYVPGPGGSGGGGVGGMTVGNSAPANTGGGGGGGGYDSAAHAGGAGGSGVVVIRYKV